MCEIVKKKGENAVSAIQNVIIMPLLLSLRHEMDGIGASVDPAEKSPHERTGMVFGKLELNSL